MAKRKTKAPKKTRDVYLSRSIREATTTKNKRGGGKKTKTVRATQGFVGSGTKTVVKTDKTGKVIKKKTKDIGNNKANRQVARSAKKAARNIRRGGEDILDYKKGGSVKVHMMYKGGKSKKVSTLAEHNRLKKLGYTHTKPKKKK